MPRETEKKLNPKRSETAIVGGRRVQLTHLAKIFWPAERYTKKDLLDYYRRAAPVILPYLKGRPESLHRYPDGVGGESFYQKNINGEAPSWAATARLSAPSEGKKVRYLVCNDAATLLFMANFGCIEVHPWLSRLGSLDRPDYLVLDLDPGSTRFDAVIEVALVARDVLEKLELPSFCKTSGATGLHIFVPLHGRYPYRQVHAAARRLAQHIHARVPGATSVDPNPAKRLGRVYLDYLRNSKGQTVVAPYSLRPRAGAPVSTPLEWREVRRGLSPMRFTMKTIFYRLDEKGDIFKPILGRGADLSKVFEKNL